MNIKILAAESLGVRGLCCSVELKDHKVVIDPGIALGWSRHGYLPHPFQVAIGHPNGNPAGTAHRHGRCHQPGPI